MTPIFKSRNALRTVSIFLGLALVGLSLGCQATQRGVYRTSFEANQRCLVVEVLDDDLVHFELASTGASADAQAAPGTAPAISRCHTGAGGQETDANISSHSAANASKAIYTTPMVFKTDYCGPTRIKVTNRADGSDVIETSEMRVAVDPKTLAVTITDITRQPPVELISWRPADGGAGAGGAGAEGLGAGGLCIDPKTARYAYGLGEQFGPAGKMDGDWIERGQRTPGCEFGNALVEYEGNAGHVGNAQFPVLYALAESGANYAMFFDGLYPQTWGFAAKEWNIATPAQPLRWYVMTGRDLPDLRKDYMELVGRPPVPPKKAFGLWVSEYGFDNWAELEDKLTTLRANTFPVDGFVLDLQWFGGVKGKSPLSRMGSLDWDEKNFPEPGRKIAELREKFGVGIIPIEESYVSEGLSEFAAMQERGYLAKKTLDGGPTILPAWWGLGGMVDWSNPAAGDYWHDLQRMPLIRDGVSGHWTDLGEPERFDPKAVYYGFPDLGLHEHRDVANAYNFRWAESIARGYERNGVKRRPFMLSRSGISGIQRFGAGMWSGDIGSRLGQLAAHMNVQMQMSFSGIDYFGADIGGFNRTSLDGDMNELYTQWFADGAAIDVPVRPHTANTENKYQTAPDRVGDMPSNLANIRQRYELTPYLYSLAHRAYLYGEPVVPPLVMYYQDDPETRRLGGEKLLGRDLLVAVAAKYGQKKVDVYLPVGGWINYHTNEYVESRGQWVRDLPLYVDGRFRLPMFARAGAIIPQMFVDEETMNVLGTRADGTRRDELIARVYPGGVPSSFTVYEDDGESIAYKSGAVRTTVISQECKGDQVIVKIAAASGTYADAPAQRDNVVKLVTGREKLPLSRDASVQAVQVNGSPLPRMVNRESFEAIERAWYDAGGGVVVAKSGEMEVGKEKVFVFETR